MRLSLSYESKLWKRGLWVAGVDEVGRGALAGPMVAAAVLVSLKILKSKARWLKEVKDSKKLTPKSRESLYEKIITVARVALARVSNTEIDKLGIQAANILVINKAVKKLRYKKNYLLVDYVANFKSPIRFESIIRGDQKIFSIACASIVAKVYRDRLMTKLHKKYPQYNWAKNKGYGSVEHRRAIKKHGLSHLHRKSFTTS